MDILTTATTLAPAAVLVITELLKFVPVAFTTKYPAWVNAIVSIIAAVVVIRPDVSSLHDLGTLFATALYIAVVAALAYNQFTSKLRGGKSEA